jgi:hypothetical protein
MSIPPLARPLSGVPAPLRRGLVLARTERAGAPGTRPPDGPHCGHLWSAKTVAAMGCGGEVRGAPTAQCSQIAEAVATDPSVPENSALDQLTAHVKRAWSGRDLLWPRIQWVLTYFRNRHGVWINVRR